MRRIRSIRCIFAAASMALLVTGCSDPKAAREARLSGIEQMEQGNYEGAIASFDTALSESDGIVGEFELDILKYRAEAEFQIEDFAAAAHTYGILADVDKGKAEYCYYQAASEAMAGNLDGAVKAYEKASGAVKSVSQKSGGEESAEETTASLSVPEQKTLQEASLSAEEEAGRSLALSAIGKAYEDQGRYDEAMDFYKRAAGSKMTADLSNRMGLCMMAAGRYDDALSYFEEGMTLGDEIRMPDLKYNEAAAYEHKGNFEKALELLEAYVSSYGSTPEIEKEIMFLESR